MKRIKEAHRHFGDFFLKNRKELIGIHFYEQACLNSKVIQSYRAYFQRKLEEGDEDIEDIEKGILKLAHLGLVN